MNHLNSRVLSVGFVLLLFGLMFVNPISVFGDEQETQDIVFAPNPEPWFTGPLIAQSARVVRPGHVKLQPRWNAFVNVGFYNSHWHVESEPNFYDLNVRLQTKFGIVDRIDFQFTPIWVFRETRGEHSTNIGDMPLDLNIQLYRSMKRGGGPALKLALRANAPIGKYQHLSVRKRKTDATGTGCWFPGPGLYFSDLWHLGGIHYLELRVVSEYRFGVPVSVKSRNVYGGDAETKGTVYPGNYTSLDAAIQWNFTQRWALACDFRYEHHNKDRFSGKSSEPMTRPSREEFSLAPAIEYNWSRDIGIIGGVWFSVAGRNTHQFANGMLSLNAYF